MSGAQLQRLTGRQQQQPSMVQPRQPFDMPQFNGQMPFVSQLNQQFAPRQPMQMPSYQSSMPSFQQLTQGGFNPMQAIAAMQRQPVQMPDNPFFGGSIPMDFSAPAMPMFMQATRPAYVAGSGNEAFLARQAVEQAINQSVSQLGDSMPSYGGAGSVWGGGNQN